MAPNSDRSLADLSQAIEQYLHDLLDLGDSAIGTKTCEPLLQTEYQRFHLWAENLGVLLVGENTSLTYRLRDAPAIYDLAAQLLEDLETALMHLLDISRGKRLPYEQSFSASQVASEALNSSRSDSSSGEPSDSDTESEEEPTQGEVAVRCNEISAIIQKLYKFSTEIRNSSTRSGAGDRPVFKNEPLESQLRFVAQLCDTVEWPLIQSHIRQSCHSDPSTANPNADDNAPEFGHSKLTNRLARANVLRRQHFRYWHEYADRRRGLMQDVDEKERRRTRPDLALGTDGVDPTSGDPLARHGKSLIAPSQPTGVTRLDPRKVRPGGTSVFSKASQNRAVVGPAGEEPAWPSIDDLPETSHFECPYCSLMCPAAYRTVSSWRAHVRHDLRPYVCTYDECELSDRLFDSRKEWQAHERFLHRRVFKCPDHPESEFTEDEYTNHVGQYHAQYFIELISDHGMLAAASTSRTLERDCPICSRACDDLESMDAHVAWHLECIALLTLPRATGLERGSQKGDVDSEGIAQGTDSRLNDSQLSSVGDLVQQKNEETLSIRQGQASIDRESLTKDALTAHLSGSSTMPVSVMSSWIQEDMSRRYGSETASSGYEVDFEDIDDDDSEIPMPHQATGPRVGFATQARACRPARDDELSVMRKFAAHAARCRHCKDPFRSLKTGGKLCNRGELYARDVAKYVYNTGGRPYSVVDKESHNKRYEIELPRDCEVIRSLVKSFDGGLKLTSRKAVVIHDHKYYRDSHTEEVRRPTRYDVPRENVDGSRPLSPAILPPLVQGNYFEGIGRGFPTPDETSVRTDLTPGGGGSMFPGPAPNSKALYNLLHPEDQPRENITLPDVEEPGRQQRAYGDTLHPVAADDRTIKRFNPDAADDHSIRRFTPRELSPSSSPLEEPRSGLDSVDRIPVLYTTLDGRVHDFRCRTWIGLLNVIVRIEEPDSDARDIAASLDNPDSEYRLVDVERRRMTRDTWNDIRRSHDRSKVVRLQIEGNLATRPRRIHKSRYFMENIVKKDGQSAENTPTITRTRSM